LLILKQVSVLLLFIVCSWFVLTLSTALVEGLDVPVVRRDLLEAQQLSLLDTSYSLFLFLGIPQTQFG